MRFYNHSHAFYCGVDLHARSMFTHILDHDGKTVFEADLPAGPEAFRNAIAPVWSSVANACSPGFGSPIFAKTTRFPSRSATRCT
jgi:hypothetical protein